MYRIPKKRSKPRRKRPSLFGHDHGLRLRGKAKEKQRRAIFARSGGYCEEMVQVPDSVCELLNLVGVDLRARCMKRITWESMEWSHNRHAANKCDCLQCGIASCRECHARKHNSGGKPCPKKEMRNAI